MTYTLWSFSVRPESIKRKLGLNCESCSSETDVCVTRDFWDTFEVSDINNFYDINGKTNSGVESFPEQNKLQHRICGPTYGSCIIWDLKMTYLFNYLLYTS